jgi:DNA-binding transcriptional LysR family regulator
VLPKLMRFTHEDLQVFALVVSGGGFSSAARVLHTTPSAVSRQVARLEDRLGIRLLHRNTRGVQLTEPGRVYHQNAQEILARMQVLEEAMEQTRNAPAGRLRISAPVALARRRLIPGLGPFTVAHPDVRVEMLCSDRIVDFFSEPLDIALRLGRLEDSSLTAIRIVTERKIICAAPAYLERMGWPRKPQDLKRHQCLGVSGQPALNRWTFGDESTLALGTFEADTTDVLIDAALAGIGVGRFSNLVVDPFLANGLLVELLAEYPTMGRSALSAVVPSGRLVPPKVRAFIDYVIEMFRPAAPTKRKVSLRR